MAVSVIVVTGSGGLVGSEAVNFFCSLGFTVVGIDNDMRASFFGSSGSTEARTRQLARRHSSFVREAFDIRDHDKARDLFRRYRSSLAGVIHCAAQPSHDWAAKNPRWDFTVNANGTLNLLEATREFAPETPFIFMSTNKVYGDRPNEFDYVEEELRWSPAPSHPWRTGFNEQLQIDQTKHSLFGVSKASADLMVQEYGRYFGMLTGVFRGGCLTGPGQAGVELHGFLSFLIKCTVNRQRYTVFGHKAKQVRDNIHSADLVELFRHFLESPGSGEVFNVGGGREANVSMIEAIQMAQTISGRRLDWTLVPEARQGDHIWYVSELSRVKSRFPEWEVRRSIEQIMTEMVDFEEFQART